MPYAMEKRDNKWCVVRVATADRGGETMKCYPESEKAKAQAYLAALRMHAEGDMQRGPMHGG